MIRRPPRSTRTDTLLPYTTRFRSNTHYTNLRRGDFSTRGLPSEETEFGVYIRDRWGNLSDTLLVTLKPLFEILLDRTQMRGVTLPTDAPLGYRSEERRVGKECVS